MLSSNVDRHSIGDSSTGGIDDIDIGRSLTLVLNQGDKVMALGIGGTQVVTGSLEEADKTGEIIHPQTAIGLDQLVQGRRGAIDRLESEEQLDRIVTDFIANHLFLVFTHDPLQRAGFSGPAVYPRGRRTGDHLPRDRANQRRQPQLAPQEGNQASKQGVFTDKYNYRRPAAPPRRALYSRYCRRNPPCRCPCFPCSPPGARPSRLGIHSRPCAATWRRA